MPTLLGETREGEATLTSRGGLLVYEETRNYIVRADYAGQSKLQIIATKGLPIVNQTVIGSAVCKSLQPVRRDTAGLLYDVVAQFSSEVEEGQDDRGDPGGTDPTAWIPDYELKKEYISEYATEDQNGKKFANSVGDPFENGMLIQRLIPVYDFYQFERSTIRPFELMQRHQTVNEKTFEGAEPKTLLLEIESTLGRYYGRRLWLNHYTLKYNDKKWTKKVQDVGARFIVGTFGTFAPFREPPDEEGGVPYIGALNGSGLPVVTEGEGPATLEFDEYKELDFSTFLRRR